MNVIVACPARPRARGLQASEKLGFGRFWEGHDFSRAVESLKMCLRFSA